MLRENLSVAGNSNGTPSFNQATVWPSSLPWEVWQCSTATPPRATDWLTGPSCMTGGGRGPLPSLRPSQARAPLLPVSDTPKQPYQPESLRRGEPIIGELELTLID